jgi:Ca2+-transporting ATPase
MIMQLSVLLIPPLMTVFDVCAMSGVEWAVVMVLAVTPMIVCELEKAVRRMIRK